MKKRVSLLLGILAVICLCSCMSVATAEECEHWAYCTAPNVCFECGYDEYAGEEIYHAGDLEYVFDEDGHWEVWTCCGEICSDKHAHWAYCTAPNVCDRCGYDEYTGGEIWHHQQLRYDENEHWYECDDCGYGKTNSRQPHFAWCDAPDVCVECGADDCAIDSYWHNDTEIYFDEYEHWEVCNLCNEEAYRSEHCAYCNTPDVCSECGADDCVIDFYWHNDTEIYYDETEHWWLCNLCGEEDYHDVHWTYCDNPQICVACGYDECAEEFIHHEDTVMDYDENEHWGVCTLCGEETEHNAHNAYCDAPNLCTVCGYDEYTGKYWHSMQRRFDENEHWYECEGGCGTTNSREPHMHACNDLNHCYYCGAECSTDNVGHYYEYYADDYEDWAVCSYCKKEIRSKHYASCDGDPGVCYICSIYDPEYVGVTGECFVSDEELYHYYTEYCFDSETHWGECPVCCDDKADEEAHTFVEDVCSVCGYEKNTSPIITKQPVDASALEGEKAKISLTATGDGLTYQWYYSTNGGETWKEAASTTTSYSLKMTEARDGRLMKCIVTDAYGNTAESDIVTLTTIYKAKITVQPTDASAYEGEKAVTVLEARGEGLTYQWYYKNPGSSSFKKSSIVTAVCAVTMTESRDSREMYCIVTDEYGNTAQSDTVTLTMKKTAAITTQPADAWAYEGEKAKVSVTATGDGLTYQWYYSSDEGETWKAASGTDASYSLEMTAARDNRQMKCVVTDAYGNTAESDVVTLDTRFKATIVEQPADAKAYEDEKAVTAVVASGDGITYQWYYKNPGSSSFKKSSITTAECAVTMTESRDGREMYCIVTDEYGNTVQSDTITLTMKKTAAITTQPTDVTKAEGETAKFKVKATGDGLTYQWYYKSPTGTEWKECSGTSATYSLKATEARNGRMLYCEITDEYGSTVKTNVVTLTVE